jgi:soluble lytic murein transglycosylase-like protein
MWDVDAGDLVAGDALDSDDGGAPQADVQQILQAAARRWRVDESTFLRIAWCESRWNPAARGPGGAAGLFQFAPMTWEWVAAGAGYPGASPYDAVANAEGAAWLMSTQGTRHWGCR